MARAPDRSSASQFRTKGYTQSWAANNPYYASHVNWAFDTTDTTRSNAAARSGVVQTAGYNNVTPQDQGIDPNNPRNWASPVRRGTAYDRLGNVNKQKGDINLGLVLMGGYQFPGQSMVPERDALGFFGANPLARWLNAQGTGGYSPMNLRARNMANKETGWNVQLSQSISSNKAPGGVGQSSEDSTIERYSTQETRMGTRAFFTDEELDEETKKFGRTWAGFKPLRANLPNPHFDSALGQMFKTDNPNVGAARRAPVSKLR